MRKTYWWRILILFLSGGIVALGWVYDTYLCFSSYNLGCSLDKYRLVFIEPAVLFSIFLLIVSPFLFFISDKVFIKWLRFALVWALLSIFAVAVTPDQRNFFPLNPSKEMVSIWMGLLFVILSIGKIVWDWRREKN